jgi:hypothetical protein
MLKTHAPASAASEFLHLLLAAVAAGLGRRQGGHQQLPTEATTWHMVHRQIQIKKDTHISIASAHPTQSVAIQLLRAQTQSSFRNALL